MDSKFLLCLFLTICLQVNCQDKVEENIELYESNPMLEEALRHVEKIGIAISSVILEAADALKQPLGQIERLNTSLVTLISEQDDQLNHQLKLDVSKLVDEADILGIPSYASCNYMQYLEEISEANGIIKLQEVIPHVSEGINNITSKVDGIIIDIHLLNTITTDMIREIKECGTGEEANECYQRTMTAASFRNISIPRIISWKVNLTQEEIGSDMEELFKYTQEKIYKSFWLYEAVFKKFEDCIFNFIYSPPLTTTEPIPTTGYPPTTVKV